MKKALVVFLLVLGGLAGAQTITLHNAIEHSMGNELYQVGGSYMHGDWTGTVKQKWNLSLQTSDSQFYLLSWAPYPFYGSLSFTDGMFKSLSGFFSYDILLENWTIAPALTVVKPLNSQYGFGEFNDVYWNLGLDFKWRIQ